jgi:hypothetical protein
MDFIITGEPSEDALSQLIESLLKHVIEHELYEEGRIVCVAKEPDETYIQE